MRPKKSYVTIHDIARELNISASTVSRALHDHPRISKETREAVRRVALKFNYQPNVMATSLRQGTSRTVGVVVPRINRSFFAHVIGGMEEVLTKAGYSLIICQSHERLHNEIDALRTLVNARVDAVLVSVSMETVENDHLREVMERGTRLYFFDRAVDGLAVDSVVIDDRLGGYLNVKHLIDRGYRRICHVAGSDRIAIYRARKQGYLDAMSEAGIRVQPAWIMERPLVLEGGDSAFRDAMQWKTQPDAFFCAGDFAALGVLQAAAKSGIRVPADLGVTGFANEPITAYLSPSLTTVDQRAGEMGRRVAELFLQCGDGEAGDRCGRQVLEPELIIRESSNPNP